MIELSLYLEKWNMFLSSSMLDLDKFLLKALHTSFFFFFPPIILAMLLYVTLKKPKTTLTF